MVTFDVKALLVAIVFALVGGILGAAIQRSISFFFIWSTQPRWIDWLITLLWLLVPAGLVGGWMLGWWLVTS